ncbi:MAG: threonine synthase [Lachnospiraceae bacterium]|nr:threonine synthase [Lachnospiraceae bacterium]
MKQITYVSTRGGGEEVTASRAILNGIAADGGLYVPTELPKPNWDFDVLKEMDYRELAYTVIKEFLTDYTEEELRACINAAYDKKFDTPEIAPLVKSGDFRYLELYHGATAAFKDMALSLLPHLLVTAAKKNRIKEKIVILTATSGDTGKAALAGFADVPGTGIVVFYPKYGVSKIQERQMVTQTGKNVCVAGITGNFDDAQTGVKKIFTDPAMLEKLKKNGYRFSSANSINIGRLVPQVAYYVWAYCRLLKEGSIKKGEEINFAVPTGNFGNILAGFYAKQLGLPVHKFICASNDNRVLTDFFETGEYNKNRKFILTESPSMDILVSSNLERLIYHIAGGDAARNAELMKDLSNKGAYTITDVMKLGLSDFWAGAASTEEMRGAINSVFKAGHYCMDTHTGVACAVAEKYVEETGDPHVCVVVSTASPYKFTASVLKAIGEDAEDDDDFALADRLEKIIGVKQPATVTTARKSPVLHDTVCETEDMPKVVEHFLGL